MGKGEGQARRVEVCPGKEWTEGYSTCADETGPSGRVRLQEEKKKVEDFKYLGPTVQKNGEFRKEVKKHGQTGWNREKCQI